MFLTAAALGREVVANNGVITKLSDSRKSSPFLGSVLIRKSWIKTHQRKREVVANNGVITKLSDSRKSPFFSEAS